MTALTLYIVLTLSSAAGLTALAALGLTLARRRSPKPALIALSIAALVYASGWVGWAFVA